MRVRSGLAETIQVSGKRARRSFDRKRIMITGGAGFLGSNLCARLLADGHEVVCVDNFSTGRQANIGPLLAESRFSVITHDICRPIFVEVDEIYNLASPASPADYQADPIGTTRTNVLGALNVLELASRCRASVLQASTSEVYGDPTVHPQPESYWGNVNPAGVRACYDEGKRCAESLFFDYARVRGVSVKVARIFNTYGPGMRLDDGRVISNFIVQALRGDDITVYGDGSQTRSFCYVDDLVEALVRFMATRPDVIGPINLGNPAEVTIRRLAELIGKLLSTRSRIVRRSLPLDDPRQRRPDITRAKEMLGWEPRMPLIDGLQLTTRYFREQVRPEIEVVAAE